MDEARIRKIVQQELANENNKSRFHIQSIPNHKHDGIDSLPISEDNVVLTKKLIGFLTELSSETFSLAGVQNVSRISFHGIAANNATDPSIPATKKSIINGEVIFGECYQPVGSGEVIVSHTVGTGLPFVQGCNYMFIDTTSVSRTTVGVAQTSIGNIDFPFDIGALAYTEDNAGNQVAKLSLVSYNGADLKFDCTLATGWQLAGNLLIQ